MREWFRVAAAASGAGGGEILIFGRIGRSLWDDTGVGAKAFVEALDALIAAGPGDVHIRINSPGGDVWDGTAIYNGIRRHRARVVTTIEGVAFSMASVIALAGREVRMWDTAQFMVHRPQTLAYGEERDLETAIQALKTARAALVTAYRNKTGQTAEAIEGLMAATTFMTAEEAAEAGFVDTVLGAADEGADAAARRPMAACFDAEAWARYYRGAGPLPVDGVGVALQAGLPAGLVGGAAPVANGEETPEEVVMVKMAEIKAACPGAPADFVLAQFEACEADETRGIVDVVKAWAAAQTAALEVERKAREAAETKAAAAETKAAEAAKAPVAPGVDSLDAAGDEAEAYDGDPEAAWDAALARRMSGGMSKAQATRDVIRRDPALHAAYLDAYNARFRDRLPA